MFCFGIALEGLPSSYVTRWDCFFFSLLKGVEELYDTPFNRVKDTILGKCTRFTLLLI